MTHVVFCSVPYLDTVEPCMAPAVLKSVAEKAGFSARGLDLNIEIANRVKVSANRDQLQNFFFGDQVSESSIDEILEYIYLVADRILQEQPRIIALSLLTYGSKIFTHWLCVHLKSVAPDTPIVIGGTGIRSFIAESTDTWADDLRQAGLIDDYIIGDGEASVVEYLQGNKNYPGINDVNWKQLEDLNVFPHPNFDDYDFTKYENPCIPVIESRGCVRSCEFCDIIEHWTKFQGRTAENVFDEIVSQAKKYNIRKISMRNSLTNGNMRVFKELLRLLANHNRLLAPEQQLRWAGYFIIRPASAHPEDFWQDLKDSNALLFLGVESVIEHVRYQMGKKFSNPDIDYHLEMGRKYQVPVALLVISGYPTETRADFEFTKQWYRDRQQYAGDPVNEIMLSMASVLPGTALERKKQDYGIVTGQYPSIWINQQLGISSQERVDMFNELIELMHELGFHAPGHTQKQAIKVIDDFA
jgi:hypothetical protein